METLRFSPILVFRRVIVFSQGYIIPCKASDLLPPHGCFKGKANNMGRSPPYSSQAPRRAFVSPEYRRRSQETPCPEGRRMDWTGFPRSDMLHSLLTTVERWERMTNSLLTVADETDSSRLLRNILSLNWCRNRFQCRRILRFSIRLDSWYELFFLFGDFF